MLPPLFSVHSRDSKQIVFPRTFLQHLSNCERLIECPSCEHQHSCCYFLSAHCLRPTRTSHPKVKLNSPTSSPEPTPAFNSKTPSPLFQSTAARSLPERVSPLS